MKVTGYLAIDVPGVVLLHLTRFPKRRVAFLTIWGHTLINRRSES